MNQKSVFAAALSKFVPANRHLASGADEISGALVGAALAEHLLMGQRTQAEWVALCTERFDELEADAKATLQMLPEAIRNRLIRGEER